jgi:hypothetical protein
MGRAHRGGNLAINTPATDFALSHLLGIGVRFASAEVAGGDLGWAGSLCSTAFVAPSGGHLSCEHRPAVMRPESDDYGGGGRSTSPADESGRRARCSRLPRSRIGTLIRSVSVRLAAAWTSKHGHRFSPASCAPRVCFGASWRSLDAMSRGSSRLRRRLATRSPGCPSRRLTCPSSTRCSSALFALLELGARDGMLYGGAMVIASMMGALAAIRPGRQRPRSAAHVEALIGGLGALTIGLVCWVALGGSIDFGTATVVLSATVICAVLGSTANTI